MKTTASKNVKKLFGVCVYAPAPVEERAISVAFVRSFVCLSVRRVDSE